MRFFETFLASASDIPQSGIYEFATLNTFSDYLIKIIIPIAIMLIYTLFVGLERQNMGKAAGISAHTLVGLSSVCLSIVQRLMFEYAIHYNHNNIQGQRIIAQIVTGVGFLGAGVIMKDKLSVKGLTTAATIYSAALLGIIVGSGYLIIGAIMAAIIIIFILIRDIKRGHNPFKPFAKQTTHVYRYHYLDNQIHDNIAKKKEKEIEELNK